MNFGTSMFVNYHAQYFLHLGLSCMISYGLLCLVVPHILQEDISYGNLCAHTH